MVVKGKLSYEEKFDFIFIAIVVEIGCYSWSGKWSLRHLVRYVQKSLSG